MAISQILGASIADGTIVAADIGDGSVTPAKLSANGISWGVSGNTSISVTDDSNPALRITQLGTGDALVVEDSTNPDISPVVINANGQLIVGSTTAQTYSGGSPYLQLNGTNASNTTIGASRWSVAATAGPQFSLAKSRGATVGTLGSVASGDTLGYINFQGDDGTSFINAVQIVGQVDGTPGTNDMPGRLMFYTTSDGSSTPTERMRINSAGNVGIGGDPSTTATLYTIKNPTGAVTVAGVRAGGAILSDVTSSYYSFYSRPSTAAAAFTLTDLAHFYAYQSTIGAGSTVTNQYGFIANSTLTGATNNYGFYSGIASGTSRWNFYAGGTAQNYFAGNTGVGTSTPSQLLHVSGGNILASNTSSTAATVAIAGNGSVVGTSAFELIQGASSEAYVYNRANSYLVLGTNNLEKMRIASTGFVGINNTTPGNLLTVGSITGVTPASIVALQGGVSGTDNKGNCIEFGHSNAAGYRSTLGALVGNGAPFLGFECEAGSTNNTFRTRGLLGTTISTDNNGAMTFNRITNGNADNQTAVESMRIDSAGCVSIGKSTNAGKALELYQSSYAALRIQNSTTGTAGSDGLLIEVGGVNALIYNYEAGDLQFGTSGTERMRINSSGSLLVGTTTIPGSASGRIFVGPYSSNNGFGSFNYATPNGGTTTFQVGNSISYRVTIFSTTSSVAGAIGQYVFVGLNKSAGYNPLILTVNTVGSPGWSFSYSLIAGTADTLVTVTDAGTNQGTRVIVEQLG